MLTTKQTRPTNTEYPITFGVLGECNNHFQSLPLDRYFWYLTSDYKFWGKTGKGTLAMDGSIVCYGIFSSCQSAATFEIVKRFWLRVWLTWEAL